MTTKFYKCIPIVLLLLLAWFDLSAQHSGAVLFNQQWKFHKGDVPQGEKIVTDDASWKPLDLPHDWSIEGPFSDAWASGTGYLPGGIGWYRKTFDLRPQQQGKIIYLYFDGVYKNSEVWINEKYAGKRPNGYASFYYDITPYLNPKGKNVVAVKVDHTDFADSRWYSGSGINRNVYLVAVNPTHIAIWGTVFTTSQISRQQATASLKVSVVNGSKIKTEIRAEMADERGTVVARQKQEAPAREGKEGEVALSFIVKNPKRWSVESPILYTLKTTLRINGKTVDEVIEKVGFREFHFDADKGFFLNGENIKLKGVCFHDDAGALGSAVPKAVWRRRLQTLKDVGCNAIRMSHNPHQDYLYDLCDEMGFLVQDEAFDEWAIGKNKWIKGWNVGQPGKDGYSKYFAEWADRDLGDMIRRNRNRACIIMWSIGNEIDYPNDPYTHEILNTGRNPQIYGKGYQAGNPPAEQMEYIAKHLVDVVKSWDKTRPVTAALAGVVMSNLTDYPNVLDVVGYNYQEYRYEDDHRQFPKRVIYGSENGKAYEAWKPVANLEYISAQYLWTAFDFIGESSVWPVRSSGAGIIDLAGFPKSEFYYRKSLWSKAPTTFLSVTPISKKEQSRSGGFGEGHWNWTMGDTVNVYCFTNGDEAELFVNNRSLGKKAVESNGYMRWRVAYQSGELKVKSFAEGKPFGEFLLTSVGEAAALGATPDRNTLKADKDDVIHLAVSVVDKDNRLVPLADNEITFSIEGPGRLLGLESGDLRSHEDYKADKRKAYKGKVLAYIQATRPGAITVTVNSVGLKSRTVRLESLAADAPH